MNKKFNLDKLNPIKLSSVTKVSKRKQTTSSERLIIYKYASLWESVAYQLIDTDVKEKVLCRLQKEDKYSSSYIIFDNKKKIESGSLAALSKLFPNVSFYAVGHNISQERIDEDLSDFISINDFVEKNILKNKSFDFNKIKFANDNNHDIQYSSMAPYRDSFSLLEKKIKDKNSPFITNISYISSLMILNQKEKSLLQIYEIFNKPISQAEQNTWMTLNKIKSISCVNTDFFKKYPLLKELRSSYDNNMIEPIAQYINLIDSI